MNRLLLIAALLTFVGCRSAEIQPDTTTEPSAQTPLDPHVGLKVALGMTRAPTELGFTEKAFNPCTMKLANANCKQQYFSVVHFQLLCRDSEGSVSSAPVSLQPIVANNVRWKVAGLSGGTKTDGNGYGQFTVLTPRSARGQRLILRIGPQFVGFSVSEVSKIVLPKNFCRAG